MPSAISRVLNPFNEDAEKELQDTSCRGSGGVPQLQKSPKDWGIQGVDHDYFSSLLISGTDKYRIK